MSFQDRLAAATRKATTVDAADADMLNKRWAKRKPASTPAKILFDGITTPFECTVRDISSTGAQIEMTKTKFNPDASSETLPHYFTLIVPLDKIMVDCQSMWRRGSKVGVRFTSIVRTVAPAKPMMARAAAAAKKTGR